MPPPSTKGGSATVSGSKQKSKTPSRKNTPKKQRSEAERIKKLFSTLCSQIDGAHFKNAIKTCDKILRIQPNDLDALHAKLFLLLQTDQYDTALLAMNETEKSKVSFEHAYALYRSHEGDEAKQVILELKEQHGEDRGLAHLEAQLFYREGLYREALELYNELLDSTEPDTEEYSDILTNLQATQRHLDFINNDSLRVIDQLPASISSNIEITPPPALAPSIPTTYLTSTQQALAPAAEKPRKVRTKRVPAGVVPGVTPAPDPERWLKKSERSSYGQGRRRRGGGGGATQGITVEVPTPGGATVTKSGGGKGKRRR